MERIQKPSIQIVLKGQFLLICNLYTLEFEKIEGDMSVDACLINYSWEYSHVQLISWIINEICVNGHVPSNFFELQDVEVTYQKTMSLYRNMSVCIFCLHFRKNASLFYFFFQIGCLEPRIPKMATKIHLGCIPGFCFFLWVELWSSINHNSANFQYYCEKIGAKLKLTICYRDLFT